MPKKGVRGVTSYISKVAKKAQQHSTRQLSLNGPAIKFLDGVASHVLGELLNNASSVSLYNAGADEFPINGVRYGGRPSGTLNYRTAKAAVRVTVPGHLREAVVRAGDDALERFYATPEDTEVA